MAQFTVYRNKNERSKATYPLLVDIQADLLDELKTRVVIPLTKVGALARKPINRLTPAIEVAGEQYLLMTPQMAGIAVSEIGAVVESIEQQRTAIVAAIDVLISGV
ncbi:MAG: CcdB family protein [Steroidobacteraceae bacterium]